LKEALAALVFGAGLCSDPTMRGRRPFHPRHSSPIIVPFRPDYEGTVIATLIGHLTLTVLCEDLDRFAAEEI
jgi:hypothetical protein